MYRLFYILMILAIMPLHSGAGPGAEEKPEQVETAPTTAEIDALVKQLGSKGYKDRKSADAALRKLPASANDQLKAHLKRSRDPEVIVRLKDILQERTTPRITIEQLAAIVVPEIEFRNANAKDCFKFLEQAGGNKFKIKINGEAAGTVTFSARQITVREALDIICNVAELQYELDKGVIVVTPGNNADMGGDIFMPVDPFAP